LRIELRAFGIYLRLLVGLVIRKALRKYDAGLIFTDESTYKQVSNEYLLQALLKVLLFFLRDNPFDNASLVLTNSK